MIVVDDGSTDDTPAVLATAASDERIRPLRIQHAGASAARNHALDHARGDVIVYLDDDNRFDPDWLRSVVWAFTTYPDAAVCYGARVVDDFDRHHTGHAGGLPWVQFLSWDREAAEEFNRVDMNVLAHRPSGARFDPKVDYYADWDLLLKLTDGADPLELPVVAAYYTTDAENRLTGALGTAAIDLQYEHVRDSTAERRARS
jgi:glycosyltransferase involved in cell wall biosynthesis